jgi:hypothetical protein
MVLNACYQFAQQKGKGMTRYDCITSTGDYEPLERLRNSSGELVIYYQPAHYIKAIEARRPENAIAINGIHITGVYFKDKEHYPNLAVGDMRETTDMLFFHFTSDQSAFTLYIGKDLKNYNVFSLFAEGGFDDEIKDLIRQKMQTAA